MTRLPLILLAGLATSITGCATMTDAPSQGHQTSAVVTTLTGELIYRERIALLPDAKLEVVLSDITHGVDTEPVLARTDRTLDRRGPPIPFQLDVSRINASAGPLFGVRASISALDGSMVFRTSTPVLVSLQ